MFAFLPFGGRLQRSLALTAAALGRSHRLGTMTTLYFAIDEAK
jgi:hypothetical protein